MKKVKMGARFLTGISKLDEQHEKILYLLEFAIESLKTKDKLEDRLQVIISECQNYIKYHLSYEEQLMSDVDYDETEKHIYQHQKFKEKLNGLNSSSKSTEEIFKDIASFIYTWFIQHIPNYDIKLAQFVKERSVAQIQKAFPETFTPVFLENAGQKIPALIVGQIPLLENTRNADVKMNILATDSDRVDFYQTIRGTLENRKVSAEDDFHPVPFALFNDIQTFPFDLYVLENVNSEHFKKIHSKEERFYFNKILELLINEKKVFYVKKDILHKVIDFAFMNTESNLDKVHKEVFFNQNDFVDLNKDFLPDGLKKLGVDFKSYNLAFNSFENIKTRVKNAPNLHKYYYRTLFDIESYVYRQNMLVSFLGTEFLYRQKDESLNEKIEHWVFASLFHDMAHTHDEHALIRNNWQLQVADISIKDKENIIHHGELAIRSLDECNNVPKGARTLILQHHGSAIGYGFPKTLSADLSDMVLLFNIIEEFAYQYIYLRSSVTESFKYLYNNFMHAKHVELIDSLSSIVVPTR